MKKIIAFSLLLALLLAFVTVPASAIPDGCTAVDITNNGEVKFASVYQTYRDRLPIVRDDAELIYADSYRQDQEDYVAPGGGTRSIFITDFDQSNCLDMLQFDPWYQFDLAVQPDGVAGAWEYVGCVWANNKTEKVGDSYNLVAPARLVYDFSVQEAGTYEFVFVGCAQIKSSQLDDDSYDRGFCYKIDGGTKYQVNISDSPLIFTADKYQYQYTMEQAAADRSYYQMGYCYGITADLSAGDHTLEFFHLEYSGDTRLSLPSGSSQGNGSRLNLAGIFVEKYLDPVALAAYQYPAYVPAETDAPTETPEQTTAEPTPTTEEPTTNEPTTNAPTTNAPTTNAPATEKPEDDGGCKSAIVSSVAVVVMACAAAVALKKH